MKELKTIQKLCHDMINMILSGGCQQDNLILYIEAILELSQNLVEDSSQDESSKVETGIS